MLAAGLLGARSSAAPHPFSPSPYPSCPYRSSFPSPCRGPFPYPPPPQFNTACPGLLGSPTEFRKNYEHPVLAGRDANASDKQLERVGCLLAEGLR